MRLDWLRKDEEQDMERLRLPKRKISNKNKEKASLRLSRFIIRQKGWIQAVFILGCILSLVTMLFVNVNYDLTEYLPDWAPSCQGLDVMEREFGYPGTARVMIRDVTLYEAKQYKDRLEAVDGVDQILWCDSQVNIYAGEDFIRMDEIEDYYKDGCAVMDVTFDEGDTARRTARAIDAMEEITGDKGYYVGMAVQNKSLTENVEKEMSLIMAVAIVMIFAVLCVTTAAWSEPILFLLVMGVAILLNRGTNIWIGTVSFLTNNVAMVLQLATSMDYSIFLLDAFERERSRGLSDEEALTNAIDQAINSILASSLTTVVGFFVLVFMEFRIGFDMGLVLAKGIVFSLLTVLFFMPAMILKFARWNDRTAHRPFLPSFEKLSRGIYRGRFIALIVMAALALPSYVAQGMNDFLYGNSSVGASEGTKVYEDDLEITKRFGRSNMLLAVYPLSASWAEKELTEALEDLPYVKSVTSMAGTLPEGIPEDFLPYSVTSELHTKEYGRMLIYIRTKSESEKAFEYTDQIRALVKQYYPEGSYLVGETPSTQDIKDIITDDYARVNNLSMLGVFLVVMFSFKSLLTPVLVMIPIEAAIFLNMAIPYLEGDTMVFMGYIIVSSIQLGATVDYSILLTNTYMDCRKTMEKKEACMKAISQSCPSIFTSGTIIILAGYIIHFISTTAAIGDLGHLIGRGALLSVILVLTVLPSLLVLFDKIITSNEWDRFMKWRKRRRTAMKKKMMAGWKAARRFRRPAAWALAAACLCSGMGSPDVVQAAPAAAQVDETMYVNLDYYGKIDQVSVVKGCSLNGNTSLTDYGNYRNVVNMSGNQQPQMENGSLTWSFEESPSDRFYYQCSLDPAQVTLPWDFDISYKLNGVPANGEDLAGASGVVEIHILAVPNEKADEYYRNNMVLMAAVPVDRSKCYSVEAEGSQTQSLGDTAAVVFSALPGEEGDFTVRIGTDSFETTGVILAMAPGTIGDLEHIKDLKEAKDTWQDAGDEFYDSLDEMAAAVEGMEGGLKALQSGAQSAEAGRAVWSGAKDGILAGNDETLAAIRAMNDQMGNMVPHIQSAKEQAEIIHSGMNNIVNAMGEMQEPLRKLYTRLKHIENQSESLSGELPQIQELAVQIIALDAQLQANEQVVLTGMGDFKAAMEEVDALYYEEDFEDEEDFDDEEDFRQEKDLSEEAPFAPVATVSNASISLKEYRLVGASMGEVLSMLQQKAALLTDTAAKSARLAETLSDLSGDISDSAKYSRDLVDSLDLMIEETASLRDSLDVYYPQVQAALSDTEELVNRTTQAVDSAVDTMTLIQNALKASSDAFDAAARESLKGSMAILDQSLKALDSTAAMRQAGRTMKDVLDRELDKFDTENRFLFMDPEAPKRSFTSDKNPEPETIQVVLRTDEISPEDEAHQLMDMETEKEAVSPWQRMWNVLMKIWQAIVEIFKER